MQKINPQIIRIGLIGIGATLLIYALNIAENTNIEANSNLLDGEQEEKPSAYLTASTFNIFNSDGKLSKLYAAKAFFFSNKDVITIEAPKFTSNKSLSNTHLIADNGYYNPTDETLLLKGNVVATQINNGSSWQLTSDNLNVDNKSGVLSTPGKVIITNGSHTLSAVGFEGLINQKEIRLLSNVRGKYVFSN